MTPLLTDSEAAGFLGSTKAALRQSRYSGKLFGVQAPPYLKLGHTVRYRQESLEDWLSSLSQFQVEPATATKDI
ncbi:DNA-binding protein [Salinimonas sediminis]|uniref:DNA-binding protein n=1 Tax=Salinimonas sediminis TaxID=2303538 RepID=A0A346NNC6_9ALTE|nr:DNA-binding protein [Salinimonas sediminis]